MYAVCDIKRITRDQHPFEQLVRIFVNNVAVFECARLGFVGVADQIHRSLFVRLDKAPFQTAGECRSAAAAKSRVFDFVDDVIARQSQRLLQLFVTTVAEVTIDVASPTGAANVFVNEAVLQRMRRPRQGSGGFQSAAYRGAFPSLTRSAAESGFTFSCNWSPIMHTGAVSQLARHSTNSTLSKFRPH